MLNPRKSPVFRHAVNIRKCGFKYQFFSRIKHELPLSESGQIGMTIGMRYIKTDVFLIQQIITDSKKSQKEPQDAI